MTPGGWFILLTSVTSVTVLFGWCLFKVLSTPNETEHLHGPGERTPDEEV